MDTFKQNEGNKIEQSILDHINKNTYIHKMNNNIQLFLKFIFNNTDLKFCKIKAYKLCDNYKPDIVIYANQAKKYISIKSGTNNSVHQEHIYSFINFLSTEGISNETITKLKLFHFNDGTTNGSGKTRKDAQQFILNNKTSIKLINENLEKIKKNILNRILFDSEYFHVQSAEYIYHGNVSKGIWASKEEILNYLCKCNINSESIHVSKLYYQSLHRNLNFYNRYEYKRYHIQFKWYSIEKDLKEIRNTK